MRQKRQTLSLNKNTKRSGSAKRSLFKARKAKPVAAPAVLPAPVSSSPLLDSWQVVAESAVGLSHRKMTPSMPCQDAVAILNSPRMALFVADGAGSAKMSDLGSQTLVQSLRRLVFSMEGLLARYLDQLHEQDVATPLADLFYRYAVTQMQDLAQTHRRSDRDFRSTLLMAIAGKTSLFWLKVGDGAMVYQDLEGQRTLIGEMDKGEYANQTVFVDGSLAWESVQFGMMPSAKISGLALMSDGAAERLVAHDGSQTAEQFSKWWQALETKQLGAEHLFQFFNDAQIWQGSTHDDKSMALAARGRMLD